MAYSADSFSAGEQPTLAKWNKLWANDASFNDGTGIASLSYSTTSISNPYKFSAYRNAAWVTSSSPTVVAYDTELFDTNNNFDITTNKGRYTAPVSGFYVFVGAFNDTTSTSTLRYAAIYVNGSPKLNGDVSTTTAANNVMVVHGLLQLTAGDYVEIYATAGAGSTGGIGQTATYFQGFLQSRT